jgi:hypothetical protein
VGALAGRKGNPPWLARRDGRAFGSCPRGVTTLRVRPRESGRRKCSPETRRGRLEPSCTGSSEENRWATGQGRPRSCSRSLRRCGCLRPCVLAERPGSFLSIASSCADLVAAGALAAARSRAARPRRRADSRRPFACPCRRSRSRPKRRRDLGCGSGATRFPHPRPLDGLRRRCAPPDPVRVCIAAPPLEVEPTSRGSFALGGGRRYLGNPRDIPLLAHAQIQLDVGRPLVAPESIEFPSGL